MVKSAKQKKKEESASLNAIVLGLGWSELIVMATSRAKIDERDVAVSRYMLHHFKCVCCWPYFTTFH